MNPNPEGIVKFRAEWADRAAVSAADIAPLLPWRARLFARRWIGATAEDIGYGNLSLRAPPAGPGGPPRLFITASQTSHLADVGPEHFCLVTDWDAAANRVTCEGRRCASSETLTHAVLYAADPAIGAVFHIHHRDAWRRLRGRAPVTPDDVPYGSPAMARAGADLLRDPAARAAGFFVMGGHEDGLVAFGATPDDAGAALERWMRLAGA